MSNNYLKRSLILSVIKEMQNKTTMRYHYTLLEQLKLERLRIQSVGMNLDHVEFSYIISGNA